MYESEIDSATKQLHAGSIRAPEVLSRTALKPDCTLEQCDMIISAFCAVLDGAHLRASRMNKSIPVQQAVCLANLGPILARQYIHSRLDRTIQTLLRHWADFRQWILYLKNDFVDRESVDISFRLLAKRCIPSFLGMFDEHFVHRGFNLILASPDLVAALFSLWHLESQDPRFSHSADSSSRPHLQIPQILDSWMGRLSYREEFDWSLILRPFGGDADALATTALDHLRQDAAQESTNYPRIAWDIHLMMCLSVNTTIRLSLLNQHSMTLVTSVVTSMVDRYATTDQYVAIAESILCGYWYIGAYVEHAEGLPWIGEIIDAGILPTILSTEPWIQYLDGPQGEDWKPVSVLLEEIIPKYSIYSSIMKPMINQLAAIEADGLPGKLDKDSQLFHSWFVFETAVRKGVTLYHSGVQSEAHMESCYNAQCQKSGPPEMFKCCGACLLVRYCSKECQVNDWKNGGHQQYCHDMRARRAAGLVSCLSKRNLHFLNRVLVQDLSLLRDRIQSAAAVHPVVLIELDYTKIPLQAEIGSISTFPELHACAHDLFLSQKWDHMVKRAQASMTPKILVRAFLAGGTFGKVKLQCLPLKRILGDVALASDEEATSELDETFDLVYSRSGRSCS